METPEQFEESVHSQKQKRYNNDLNDVVLVSLLLLKLVPAIFYQFLIFSPNDSPSKTMKNVFYFIEKALFVLEIFKFS